MKAASSTRGQLPPLRVAYAEAESSSSSRHRALLHPSILRSAGIATGSIVAITISSGASTQQQPLYMDAWPSSELDSDTICLPQYLCPEIVDAATATLVRYDSEPSAASCVILVAEKSAPDADNGLLEAQIRAVLLSQKYASTKQAVSVDVRGVEQTFTITRIDVDDITDGMRKPLLSSVKDVALVKRATKFVVEARSSSRVIPQQLNDQTNIVLAKEAAYATLGGLDSQIEELRQLVELPLRRPEVFSQYGLRPPRGVLLFGPPGTGKTTLAYSAARACVSKDSILTISGPELSSSLHGGTERALRKLFTKAQCLSPSIVIIDEIDALAPRRDGDSADGAGEVEKRVVATLLTLMDGLGGEGARVVVIAATNRPNALDPALRRPGRLDKEVEVGIPSSNARLSILRVLLKGVPHRLGQGDLEEVASCTHGYVGADLSSLVREAGMHAIQRDVSSPTDGLHEQMNGLSLVNGSSGALTKADFAYAQARVRPSAMREITLEMPKVSWSDIAPGTGGQEVQQRIRECVEWPLRYRDTMQALGIDAPRGVLLYGPPGCSKTLIARALASESGLNFVAVKGPELLNKYVGESERALREIFRKARAASPSIIFFDEIDGMTTTRGADSGGPGDKLIATLLNEMDGVEQLSNVLVVAATNRPDVLDPALLRPGRLDRLLYVGPPDYEARRQILAIRARKMAVANDVDFDAIAQKLDGCSGAEVVSVCQDAGLRAMNEDVQARFVRGEHFEQAASAVRRRITPHMLRQYEAWRDQATL